MTVARRLTQQQHPFIDPFIEALAVRFRADLDIPVDGEVDVQSIRGHIHLLRLSAGQVAVNLEIALRKDVPDLAYRLRYDRKRHVLNIIISEGTDESLARGDAAARETIQRGISDAILQLAAVSRLKDERQRLRSLRGVGAECHTQTTQLAAAILIPMSALRSLDKVGELQASVVSNRYGTMLPSARDRIRRYRKHGASLATPSIERRHLVRVSRASLIYQWFVRPATVFGRAVFRS